MGCTKIEGIIEGGDTFFCFQKKGIKELKNASHENVEEKLQSLALMMSMLR